VTSIEQELGNEISKAVEQIVAASHAAATKALDEAFGGRRIVDRTRSTARKTGARTHVARRTSEQIQELKDSVYQALCATPGQTMVALAKQLGTIPRHLHVPVVRLKTEDLIRSAGKRHSIRYYPRNSCETKLS